MAELRERHSEIRTQNEISVLPVGVEMHRCLQRVEQQLAIQEDQKVFKRLEMDLGSGKQ